jgi:AAA family ATP:ADP antiporter
MSEARGAPPASESAAASRLERVLRLFTDVRPGEGRTALALFGSVFLLLCAYYLIKPLRESWIAVSSVTALSKMEVKAYTSFGQALLLLFATRAYAPLVDRWKRVDLLSRVMAFCMVVMVVFWFLQPDFFIQNLPVTGIVFYLWVGMFGVFVVAQFWAFVADLYTDERGRRLIPLVAIGATSGAVAGSWFTENLVRSKLVPTEELLLVALLPLACSMALARRAEHLGAAGPLARLPALPPEPGAKPAPGSGVSAIRLILGSRLLIAVALLTMLLNWVNTNGENLLFRVIQDFLADEARSQGIATPSALLAFTRSETAVFYGSFYFWVNGAALVLQCFFASRLLKYGGFGVMLLFAPTISLLAYSAMALVPVLAVVKAMKVVDNATDYSISNTARNVLWLPVPALTKLKAKPAVDSLFARAGDGMSALTVLIGVQLLDLGTGGFFTFTVCLVVAWLVVAVIVAREHARLLPGRGDPPEEGATAVGVGRAAQPAAAGGGL